MATKDKRIILKPIKIVEFEIEQIELHLRQLLDSDLSTLCNCEEIHNAVSRVKSVLKAYKSASMEIVKRLIPSAVIKALEYKRIRVKLHNEVKEMVSLGNSLVASWDDKDLESEITSITSSLLDLSNTADANVSVESLHYYQGHINETSYNDNVNKERPIISEHATLARQSDSLAEAHQSNLIADIVSPTSSPVLVSPTPMWRLICPTLLPMLVSPTLLPMLVSPTLLPMLVSPTLLLLPVSPTPLGRLVSLTPLRMLASLNFLSTIVSLVPLRLLNT